MSAELRIQILGWSKSRLSLPEQTTADERQANRSAMETCFSFGNSNSLQSSDLFATAVTGSRTAMENLPTSRG